MATPMTNAQLRVRAAELAEELDEEIPNTDRMNNAKLTALVEGLEAKREKQDAEGEEPDADPQVEEPPPQIEPKKEVRKEPDDKPSGFFVSSGRTIITRRGTRRAGERILPKDFASGEEEIRRLIARGAIEAR